MRKLYMCVLALFTISCNNVEQNSEHTNNHSLEHVANTDKVFGFRKIGLEAPKSNFTGLVLDSLSNFSIGNSDENQFVERYYRVNENLDAGDVKLENVYLTFFKDSLMTIEVKIGKPISNSAYASEQGIELVNSDIYTFYDYLVEIYGPPHDTTSHGLASDYTWSFNNSEIRYSFQQEYYGGMLEKLIAQKEREMKTAGLTSIEKAKISVDISQLLSQMSKNPFRIYGSTCMFTSKRLAEDFKIQAKDEHENTLRGQALDALVR